MASLDEHAPLIPMTSSKEFPVTFLYSRWQSFCSACLILLFAGGGTAFSIYSSDIQTYLSLSQQAINLVESISTFSLYFTLIVAFMIERFGVRYLVVFGSMCMSCGFFGLWASLSSIIPSNFSSISIVCFTIQLGSVCFVNCALTLCIKLFPIGTPIAVHYMIPAVFFMLVIFVL